MDHAETVQTTPPPEGQQVIGSVVPPDDTESESDQLQTSVSNAELLLPLPFGWEERYAPAGSPYYVDHMTSTVHLIRPHGQRDAFLLSQPDLPTDIAGLPGFRPPEATYSTLVSQLISVYRSPLDDDDQDGLLGAVLGRSRSRTTSDEDLRSTLELLLHNSVPLEARNHISDCVFRVACRAIDPTGLTRQEESDWAELLDAIVIVLYIPAPVGVSLPSPASNEPTESSANSRTPRITLKRDHAWCYVCKMDFGEPGGPSRPRAQGGWWGEDYLPVRPCGHIFHHDCFDLYARSESMLCPLCPRLNPVDNPQASSSIGPSVVSLGSDREISAEVSPNGGTGANRGITLEPHPNQEASNSSRSEASQTDDDVTLGTRMRNEQNETSGSAELAIWRMSQEARAALPIDRPSISHPLSDDRADLARLQEVHRHELAEQRVREREWEQRKRERCEAFIQKVMNSCPLMLYIPAPKEVASSEDGHLEIDLTWEENWLISDLPYIPLEEHRCGCYIYLLDFEEPRRRDEFWDEQQVYETPEPLILLPCSHACHKSCMDQWILEDKETCPYCRSHMVTGLSDAADAD